MLELKNAQQMVTLALTSRVLKYLGVLSIGDAYTGTTKSGTLTDSRLNQFVGCTPFALILTGDINVGGFAPLINFNGANLEWSFPKDHTTNSVARPNSTFIYGIF